MRRLAGLRRELGIFPSPSQEGQLRTSLSFVRSARRSKRRGRSKLEGINAQSCTYYCTEAAFLLHLCHSPFTRKTLWRSARQPTAGCLCSDGATLKFE